MLFIHVRSIVIRDEERCGIMNSNASACDRFPYPLSRPYIISTLTRSPHSFSGNSQQNGQNQNLHDPPNTANSHSP